MSKVARSALPILTSLLIGAHAHAAACGPVPKTVVDIIVREAPLLEQQDLSLSDLNAMAAQLRRQAPHPIFGLYAGAIGYAVKDIAVSTAAPPADANTACPAVAIRADLVVVDRRIVVASDLSSTPCRLRKAIDHYRHHAAAASIALHRLASELPGVVGPEVDHYISSRPVPLQNEDGDLRLYVESLLNESVRAFTASLARVQAEVDSSDEARRLSTPCGDT